MVTHPENFETFEEFERYTDGLFVRMYDYLTDDQITSFIDWTFSKVKYVADYLGVDRNDSEAINDLTSIVFANDVMNAYSKLTEYHEKKWDMTEFADADITQAGVLEAILQWDMGEYYFEMERDEQELRRIVANNYADLKEYYEENGHLYR